MVTFTSAPKAGAQGRNSPARQNGGLPPSRTADFKLHHHPRARSALTLTSHNFILNSCPENDPARLYLPVFPVRSWARRNGGYDARIVWREEADGHSVWAGEC
jgi:hypothetical protein